VKAPPGPKQTTGASHGSAPAEDSADTASGVAGENNEAASERMLSIGAPG
jgi:hypothetical protein